MRKNILIVFCSILALAAAGQNIPRPNIDAPQGLQVNSFTGNLFYMHSDITLRGVGFPVYGAFYYNAALDTLDYGFGHGWNFYYNIFYTASGDTVIIHHSDAKKDTFRLVGGVYKSPTGVFDVLTKSGSEYVLTAKEGIKHYFSDPVYKKLTRITDPNGNFISTVYSSGQLQKVRNSSGRTLVLAWTNGKLQSIQDSALPGKKYTYTYDSNNDLVSITNPLNASKTMSYSNHRLLRLADENTNPVVIQYGRNGKVKSINSCTSSIAFNFLDSLRKTLVTYEAAAGNLLTTYDFDSKGRLIAVTDPSNKKATFSYDANNNLVQMKDWKGQAMNYAYDTKGNLLTETDAQGNVVTYSYEPAFNKPNSVKDKRGNTATMNYNAANGNLTSVQKPLGVTEGYDYFAGNGNLKTFTNANGKNTGYEYNADGDLSRVTYPIGDQRFEYNGSCCNLSRITDGNGNSVQMTYDLMNRLKTIKDDLNNTIQNNYDAAGNLTEEIDANGHKKNFGYDALNRLTGVTLNGLGTWNYSYDGVGNLTDLTDANSHKTLYGYNNKNQLVKETDPLGNTTMYSYDDNGNVISKTYPNGNSVQYKYDELNRLVEKSYPGNTDKYSYDANGNLTSAFNNNITYTFEYDALNRLVKKNIVTWGKSIRYSYDAVGNRLTMTDHDGGIYNYGYDDNNRLTAVKPPFANASSFEYDPGGRLTKQTNPNGTFTNYSYDVAGRLTGIQHKRNAGLDISFFNFTAFDKQGNRKTMVDKYGTSNYIYDTAYRLVNVQYGGGAGTESFSIDPTGNRTQQVKNGVETNYTYNSADQLLGAGTSSFHYDANGNTTQQTDSLQKKYEYDGENRLVKATLNNVKTVQWLYDPFGEKIQRTDTNGLVTKFIYDGDNLLAELNSSNATITKYCTALGIDSWIGFSRGGSNYFYHKDGLNSVTEITDNAGATVKQYRYDAYGNLISQSGSLVNTVMYTGRLWEGNVGLYDYRSRLYNNQIGRFNTKDAYEGNVESPLSLNHYSYVNSNPINYIDNAGNVPQWISNTPQWVSDAGFFVLGTGIAAITGLKAGAAFLFFGTLGGLNGMYNTYRDGEKNNQSLGCYSYNFGKGAISGILPIANAMKKIPGLKNIISSYEKGIEQIGKKIKQFSWSGLKYEFGRRWNTVIPGLPIEFLISDHVSTKFDDLIEYSLPYNPCYPNNKGGNQDGSNESKIEELIENIITVIRALDPNEIIGTNGYGDAKWVSYKANLPYKIYFENDPELATAAAQRVSISMPISSKLNPNSLRLGDFGFGSFNFSVPPNSIIYSKRLDVKDSLGVFVDVTAGLDIPNRRAFWIFESIDPATGFSGTLPPTAGFLPVNDSITRKGEGYVSFTLQPADSVKTLDIAEARAAIVFDTEDSIFTNTWVNTIDAGAPTSSISVLPAASNAFFPVRFTGADDPNGAGLQYYDIYYSKNNEPFALLRDKVQGDSIIFPGGDIGTTYAFFSIATDYTGNREPDKFAGERSTTVSPQFKSICPGESLTISIPLLGVGYSYRWQIDQGSGFSDITDNIIYSGTGTNIVTITAPPTSWTGYKFRCVAVNGSNTVNGTPWTLKFSNTWTGAISKAWEIPGNWSCNSIPDENVDVTINPTVNSPEVSSTAVCRSLLLGNGVQFTVKAGFKLDIKGR